jgi:fumarate hydratase subunit alpha
MKIINKQEITKTIARLCVQANRDLPDDIQQALVVAREKEESDAGRAVLDDLIVNAKLAREKKMPICQDTGMAVVFVDIGQEVHISGGWIEDAINAGVVQGYRDGLRASIVQDPLDRVNTGTNTPAVIHYQVVPGDTLHLTVAPKGFGSENMSAARMLYPAEGIEGLRQFVLETVEKAGPNACPPFVIGVGIGGTLEKAAILSKRALLVPIRKENVNPYWAAAEKKWLSEVNDMGIGPGGLGGRITALALHILTYPTHIAGLPAVVNMSCHATRHAEAVL